MVVYGGYSARAVVRESAPDPAEVEATVQSGPNLKLVSDQPGTGARDRTEPGRYPNLSLFADRIPRSGFLPSSSSLWSAPAWSLGVKRSMDVALATLVLVLLSPVMLAAALAVKLTSRGPVFFTQVRIGKDGRAFRFVKFRTMRVGSDAMKQHLGEANEADGPIFKIKRDPRITPVGRILRKLSIDELPQLVHVLRGHMSLVGFRPPLADEFEQYCDWERQRVRAKPGLTCIWQVSGRSDLDFGTWVKMDLEYIERWSLWLDIKILLLTIPAVLSGRGAY